MTKNYIPSLPYLMQAGAQMKICEAAGALGIIYPNRISLMSLISQGWPVFCKQTPFSGF